MKDIELFRVDVNEHFKGSIKIDNEDYAAELNITKNHIEVRFFDFNNRMSRDYSSLLSLETAVFNGGGLFFRFFGMELSGASFRLIGHVNSFKDYKFSAKGVIYSRSNLNNIESYQAISFYSGGINKWLGNTSKINKIINDSIVSKLPEQADLVEFKRTLKNYGTLGGYYSYKYGGLDGIYSVGMSVTPHITLHFEKLVDLNGLLDNYIDLYMIMRFLIGKHLNFTSVKICAGNQSTHKDINLYLPEKIYSGSELHNAMSFPYSSAYHDASEKQFPLHIFDNYFSEENKEVNLLLKKFINYSLVDSDEERFLGFYRILEMITYKQSFYVDENELSVLLERAKGILQKKFKGSSISKFKRAVLRANKSKENTETCVRRYIKNMPQEFVSRMGLNKIKIDELCKVRNNMTHQPLFSVSESKLYDCMVTSKLLVCIILMSKLGVPINQIEEVANLNGWKDGLSYLI